MNKSKEQKLAEMEALADKEARKPRIPTHKTKDMPMELFAEDRFLSVYTERDEEAEETLYYAYLNSTNSLFDGFVTAMKVSDNEAIVKSLIMDEFRMIVTHQLTRAYISLLIAMDKEYDLRTLPSEIVNAKAFNSEFIVPIFPKMKQDKKKEQQ
jgi:hypothetical protein